MIAGWLACLRAHRFETLNRHDLPPHHQRFHDPGRRPDWHGPRRRVHLRQEVPGRDFKGPEALRRRDRLHGQRRPQHKRQSVFHHVRWLAQCRCYWLRMLAAVVVVVVVVVVAAAARSFSPSFAMDCLSLRRQSANTVTAPPAPLLVAPPRPFDALCSLCPLR